MFCECEDTVRQVLYFLFNYESKVLLSQSTQNGAVLMNQELEPGGLSSDDSDASRRWSRDVAAVLFQFLFLQKSVGILLRVRLQFFCLCFYFPQLVGCLTAECRSDFLQLFLRFLSTQICSVSFSSTHVQTTLSLLC